MRREGRVLQEEAPPGAVLAEGHVRRAGSLSRSLRNASAVGQHGLMGVDEAAMRSANARLARVSAVPRAIPEPEHLASDTLRNAVRSPMARLIALQAEHGSMTDRFSSFIERFNSLRDRWNELNNRRHERARELSEARSRRLSEMPVHPDKLYDALEQAQAKRARRRLAELDDAAPRTGVLELPESHALSWLHDIVDWRAIGASASHLFDVEQRRVHARDQGYSVEEAVRLHPTGWSWFDNPDYAHSTAIGDAGRRLRHRILHGADPPWHNESLHARISNRASHPNHGMARRALESIFEGTVAAPFSFYGEVLATGLYVPPTDASFWEASLRYIVGSTVGCYFTAPVEERSRTQGGDSDGESEDGEAIKILRPSAEKMCFPACASPPAPCRVLGRQRLLLAWQGHT